MKYFEIENGIVVNSIVASAEFINTLEGTYVESQKEFGIGDTYDGTSFSKAPVEPIDVEPIDIALVEKTERKWRNDELSKTDSRSIVLDDPEHDAIIAYRVALRDWPTTSDFPDTKPTL
jgi:hypothetical protein